MSDNSILLLLIINVKVMSMFETKNKYSASIAKCSGGCPGRISPWRAALGEKYACPMGVAFCGTWDADNIIVKSAKVAIPATDRHEDAA